MHSKIMILIWERWQRTRWAVIAACLLPISGHLMYMTGYTTLEHSIAFTRIFWLLGFVMLTFLLLVGHCETRDLDLSFPKRLFRLPVRTSTLFTVWMGYGVAAVALQSLILFGFDELFFDSTNYRWSNLLIPETVYIVLQTVSWLSWLPAPGARFLYLSPLLTGVYVYSLLFFGGWYDQSMNANILCPVIILLCSVISFWTVSMHRHSAWIIGSQWIGRLLDIFRRRPTEPFKSALHAQIWFEWRQTGHVFPLAALCAVSLLLCWYKFALGSPVPLLHPNFDPIFVPKLFPIVVPILIQIVFVPTVFVAFISGFLVFGVYHRDHISGASSFWLLHPMSTRDLAVARLQAMARSFSRVLVILMVVILAVAALELAWGPNYYFPWITGPQDPLKGSLPLYLLFTVTRALYYLYIFAILYWILFLLAPMLLAGGVAAFFISWLIELLIGKAAILWVWYTLAAGLPLCVLGALYVVRRRNLISTAPALVIAACLFILVEVSLWTPSGLFFTVNDMWRWLPGLSQTKIILLISAATLPFIPVVALPLLIDKLRHR